MIAGALVTVIVMAYLGSVMMTGKADPFSGTINDFVLSNGSTVAEDASGNSTTFVIQAPASLANPTPIVILVTPYPTIEPSPEIVYVTEPAGDGGTPTYTATVAADTPTPLIPVSDGIFSTSNNGPAPLTVSFTDSSTNNPTSWYWNFGDGDTSTQQNPTYTYNNPGIYHVTLTASNENGSRNPSFICDVTVTNGSGTL